MSRCFLVFVALIVVMAGCSEGADLLNKPGQCPREVGPGSCDNMCTNDSSCPGIQKCCRNPCGFTCANPINL
ncbi:hypothetical protein O3G_MSEX006392 [Manduca sexta]|uniref:WAP domain-containing protein n=1 Tax=Manduca sexta TaxID=7130 RepID=A0A921Z384_MANSE|nr:hypothetical protein O3G_MSEX006392 [Manduca sexta]KAG6450116.1 hypothetical protein O3G_MSEX006392 [Manduca sexta]